MMALRNAKGRDIELGRLAFSAQKTASIMEAAKIRLLSVDNNRSAIMVNIPVVITLLDDDGFVTVLMITDDVTVTVPVTISVTLTNRYANRADTNAHLFRSSRHCAENSGYGGDHYGILNHCVLLSMLSSARAMPRRRDRSGFRLQPGGNKRERSMLNTLIRKSEWLILLTCENLTEFSHTTCPSFSKIINVDA
jgi:hypothetical protein